MELTPAHSRKSKEDEGNSNDAPEDIVNSRDLQRHDSGDLGAAPERPADDDALMDTASDVGSERQETRPNPADGFSATNAGDGARTSSQGMVSAEFTPLARLDQPQQHHSSTSARIQQLQWSGEQSMTFGSDITYTYYPFLAIGNLSNVSPQDISYLEMQGCFRVPAKTTLDGFVKQFFLHVHPMMPLVNEGDFWDSYQAGGTPLTDQFSLLLLQAMLFSACSVSWPSRDSKPV